MVFKGPFPPNAFRDLSLQCAERIPEAGAVLDLLEKCPEHQKKGGFPVIVFEGLDATGKSNVRLKKYRWEIVDKSNCYVFY